LANQTQETNCCLQKWLQVEKTELSEIRIANSQNLPVDEMLKNLQEKLEADINEIKREVVAIPDLDSRCLALRVNIELIVSI
jgi:hypothetical protein